MKKHFSAENALSEVKSGDRIFIHGAAATPHRLIHGLLAHASRLKNVEIMHLHTDGEAAYAKPDFKDSFRVANLFVGGNIEQNESSKQP